MKMDPLNVASIRDWPATGRSGRIFKIQQWLYGYHQSLGILIL